MAQTDYDIILAGVKAKLIRGEGAYLKRTSRSEIQQQVLTQSEGAVLTSRADRPGLFQSSWADGARWWKPLLRDGELNSYFQGNHMDAWSEPGKIIPTNLVLEYDTANDAVDASLIAVNESGIILAIGETTTVNASFRDLIQWVPGDAEWGVIGSIHSGVPAAAQPRAMTFDVSDGYLYIFDSTGDIVRTDPGTAVNATWISTAAASYGASLFTQRGNLMFYDGDKLYTVDKASPALETIADDGLGLDALNRYTLGGVSTPFEQSDFNLAISTAEGIYYVKNVFQGGQPSPYLFRVDRDAAGNWNLNPIMTLPRGVMAVNIAYHMGSVVIATTPNWADLNQDGNVQIDLYHVTQGGAGSLGSMLGGREALDETPFMFLGASGSLLYIAGGKRLWVYDAVRGGIHTVFEFPTTKTKAYRSMAASGEETDGYPALFIHGLNETVIWELTASNEPSMDIVTNFGDDETHYILTSNYFDGNLPMEIKEISKVSIQRDPGDGNTEWTVQVQADDGSWADALVHSTTGQVYAQALVSGVSGYRFRYRVIYQTKTERRDGLRALLISMNTGENVSEWQLQLDGAELLNVDNEVQDEASFRASLESIAATEAQVDFVDNFIDQDQDIDSATTVKVKVQTVQVTKEKPGESVITVVLREA